MTIEIGENLLKALPELRNALCALAWLVPIGATISILAIASYADVILIGFARVVSAWKGK